MYQVRVGEFIKVAKDLEIKDVTQEGEILPLNDVDVPETPADGSEVDSILESKQSDHLLTREDKEAEESKAHRCEACGARFRKISDVLRHARAQHEPGNVRQREEIEIESKDKRIKAEIDIKAKLQGIKYPCNACDYQGNRKEQLQRHIRTKHEGVKYPCNQCDYQAATKYFLLKHIKSKH